MDNNNAQDMNLFDHLEELRKAILFSLLALVAASCLVYAFYLDDLLSLLTFPITKLELQPVIIGVTEGFFVRLKTAVLGGTVFALPVIIWQVLRFVFPALYEHEKKIVLLLVFGGVILFLAGMLFSYYFILELALKLMLVDFSGGLSPMVSLEKYLSFIIMMLLPFGLIFEIPMITLVLTRIGLLTPSFMKKHRKYVILGSFVLAALLTPPDIISQVMLAFPMVFFYEISILISRIAAPRRKEE